MKQITPQIYAWSQYQPDRELDFNGHFVQAALGEPGVLVDPVPFQPGDENKIRALGGAAAVLLTNGDHVRAAAACRETFGCPVLVPRADLERAGLPGAEPFDPHDPLPAGLHAIPVPGNKSSGETALYHPRSATLIVGDAVIGSPPGRLSLLAADKYDDMARAARGLRVLLAPPVRWLLVGDGQSLFHEPEHALQELIYQHDPAAFLLRQEELTWQPPRAKGSRFQRRSAEYSRLLGLKVLDFELTAVPPGKQNTLLHRHDGLEEVFVVLEGQGEVHTEQGAFPVAAGDVLGFPPRYQVAHAIRNSGDEELRFLAFAALAEPPDAVGLTYYPESGKQLQWVGGPVRLFYLPDKLRVDYWEGERVD